jgi:hypothetical protein
MSYPGRMGGVVKAGTKKLVEEFFVHKFPIAEVWDCAPLLVQNFDEWHAERIQELGQHLDSNALVKKSSDKGEAVAAKFMNTYLHQLMKYESCRPLWEKLHLPLDRRILVALGRLKRSSKSRALSSVNTILHKPPYSIPYTEYLQVQHALLGLIAELNGRPKAKVKLRSRIELNLLWAE